MNRIIRKYLSGCIMTLISGMMLSCLPEDDFQDIEIMAPSPRVSLPILNTNLALSDLITVDQNSGTLLENEDKSYSLFYKTKVQSQPVSTFFPEIPEQNYSQDFSLLIGAPSFYGSPPPTTFSDEIPLQLNNLKLYKLECGQGNITITLGSSYQHDVKANLTFPDIQDAAGNPLQRTFDLKQWGTNPVTQIIPLETYSINIADSKISYEIEVTIEGSGAPINATDKISLDFNMAGIEFSYIEGNFTNIEIPVQGDSLNIPVLANAINGNVALNPKLRLDFSNSYGVQILPDLSNIFVRRKSGSTIRLQDEGNGNFFSGNFDLPYPDDRMAGMASKTQTVDEANSNIEDAFAEIPKGIDYSFGFTLNSAETDTSFITAESMVGVDMQVELPLEGSFNIILEDTIGVNFKSIAENLEELKVLIKTENSFPIDAKLQVYFLDAQGNKITDENGQALTLFDDDTKFLTAATITNTSTGETQPQRVDMPLVATINNTKYDLLNKTKNFLVRADLTTVSEQDNLVKLYSFYNIRFSMSMQVKPSL